jgi:cephalosporin hydroxylase
MNLEELCIKHKTDKQILKGHGYSKYYEQYFEPMRNNNLTILELGVREGWSMTMWEEYFPNAHIWGIDNDFEQKCPKGFSSPRLHFHLGSQTDDAFLNKINKMAGGFDIIIDDCSHISPLTIKSHTVLFPLLKSKGIYVIEDLHTNFKEPCTEWEYNHYNPYGIRAIDYLEKLNDNNITEKTFYLNQKMCFMRKK